MNASDEIGEVVGAVLILIGAIFSLISAIGIVRLPDVYTRSHAASKSSTLGVLCALLGTLLYFIISDGFFSIRLILGIFFVFLTAPVAAHVITRAAYRDKVPLAEQSVQDELKDYYRENEIVEVEVEDKAEAVNYQTK
ncbi:Na+/H+ antiporter subunit G [Paenibacillus radicis (ex Gao et al. 2016)]|uniref:Na+/H+ antiporter subunit G n=1 Tax=Paenibacillus radicis (ex Gao et al. 2016) TaxID=1737354 RepID=A0A917H4Q6_9BACL|nr:Na+/H+ antiporter subunit G [Paenibacillus radicis (ex Gao et al. 2016)]GGG67579.1 Na+/H+ antiporter subunit G [Paenibacillus radicis (ex Gao et al. 2016)]